MKPSGWELPVSCWKPGQGQRNLCHLVSRSFPQRRHHRASRHSRSSDTIDVPSGPVFPSLSGFQRPMYTLPFFPQLKKGNYAHSRLETIFLKWCKKLKIMKNNWVQIPGNIRCLIQKLFVKKKIVIKRGFYIRNSCSEENTWPLPPHSSPREGPHSLEKSQSLRWWGDVRVFSQSPRGFSYYLKLKYGIWE